MKKFKQHIVFALQLVDFGILIFFENQSIKLNLVTHFIALMRKENGKIDESTFEHVFDTRRTNSFSNGKFQTGHTTKYLNANISMIQYISAEMLVSEREESFCFPNLCMVKLSHNLLFLSRIKQ